MPIYKKDSVYAPEHYRGIHLTSTISKVVERAIGNPLIRYLEQCGYGANQWGFKKLSSARDLTLVCMSTWILNCCRGQKVALYLSDISFAFDRFFKDFMLAKLHSAGVADVFIDFLSSYLEPRIGQVAIEGVLSECITLADMVFQGTVLGPMLWNCFFQDVALPATSRDGKENLFADDLSIYKCFSLEVSNFDAIADMQFTKNSVHMWGARNRVAFDPETEHVVVLHPSHGEGELVKLLGCIIDPKMTMMPAIGLTLSRARPKVKALLRTRGIYKAAHLIIQYKTHIWGLIEYHYGAILHATPTAFARLDRLQASFLEEMHLTPEVAFLEHNFAPPMLRRDIGILGFIPKRVFGHGHPALAVFLPFASSPSPWHSKPLENFVNEVNLYFRSIFSMVHVINRLYQDLAEIPTVMKFPKILTQLARRRCANGGPD